MSSPRSGIWHDGQHTRPGPHRRVPAYSANREFRSVVVSFMVTNTGRAASRAFYLNLKRQPGILTMARHQFDHAADRYLRKRDDRALNEIAVSMAQMRAAYGESATLGVVFHRMLRALKAPLRHKRNRDFLEFVRDSLRISCVFFPVREPAALFLSEFNRQRAAYAGDWKFPAELHGWKPRYEAADLDGGEPADGFGSASANFPDVDDRFDLHKAMAVITSQSADILALYDLFNQIFDKVYVFDYKLFLDDPLFVFNRIAEISGADFDASLLLTAKLNSLANRLLVYNPITIDLPPRTGRFGFGKPAARAIRFRVEMEDIIELCDDWGRYRRLELDCDRFWSDIGADVGSRVGLGVCLDDLAGMSSFETSIFCSQSFMERMVERTGPRFARCYADTKLFYNERVHCAPPQQALDEFLAGRADGYARLLEMVDKAACLRL